MDTAISKVGANRHVGDLLRDWRQRRRLSQLDLACEAEISTRHLSFVETGRSLPSREMVLLLAEHLDIPLRERNTLLTVAGLAPVFRTRALDDPALVAARSMIDLVLAGHVPNPALAVDRHWTLVAANDALKWLIEGVDAMLLRPPVNVLRLALHPAGLAPRTANLREWRAHIIGRLRRQFEASGDTVLSDMIEEFRDYPLPKNLGPKNLGPKNLEGPVEELDLDSVAVPFRLETADGTLSFLSMTTVFGTPVDVTLSELAIESFFPADAETAAIMRRRADLAGAAQAAGD